MLIGTAGHIDHGKTTLLAALTGTDTDRLPEEKRRGITIELGYAFAALPGGGRLGFIDVPGHERFVPTMLTGAAGIDFALLVVAADDGVMPQTREHLAILDLLGVARGAVALSKCDRADAARVDAVRGEIDRLLAPTPLAGSAVFAVSAPRGEGVEALRTHLFACAVREAPRAPAGGFRLAIDRRFAIAGAGTVVTGTVHAGCVRVGEHLVVARPDGFMREVRVRGLHANGVAAEAAEAGCRCAANLVGIDHGEVERGDWLCAPSLARPTDRLDLRVRLLADAPRRLAQWSGLHLHHAAGQVEARLALLDASLEAGGIAPGESALVQAVLDRPVLACWGDRVILRDAAGRATVGGGRVVDAFPPARHRRRPERLALLAALEEPDPLVRLRALLAAAPLGIAASELAAAHNADVEAWLAGLDAAEYVVAGGDARRHLFGAAPWAQLGARVAERLAQHHAAFEDEPGVERERLRRMVAPRLPGPIFAARLAAMAAAGAIEKSGAVWRLPGHRVELGERDRARAERLLPWLAERPADPPWVREIAGRLGEAEADTRVLMRRLAARGELFQVVRDLFYASAAVAALARLAATVAAEAEDARVRAADFRDRLGIGRKRAIQILEFFDRVGYTRRVGEGAERAHVIRGEPPAEDADPAARVPAAAGAARAGART